MKKIVSILAVGFFTLNLMAAKVPSLKDAISANNVEQAKAALAAGADPNEEYSGSRAIYWATFQSNCEMIKLLVEKGAKVDGTGMLGLTALNCAVDGAKEPAEMIEENNKVNAKILKNFTEEKAKEKGWWKEVDPSKFSTAAEKVKLLLDLGADPNLLQGNMSVKEWTPFLTAVDKGKLDLVKIMLDSKKVDTEFRFHQWSGGVVKFVNYTNASANRGEGFFNQRDWEKKDRQEWAVLPIFNTPLLFAVENNNLELVKILVEGGASLYNGKKTEKTEMSGKLYQYKSPLDIAIEKNLTEIADYLKSKDAIRYQE